MKTFTPLASLAVVGSVLATGPLALATAATATPKGGAIKIFVTDTSATKGKITIVGAIGDHGTTVSEDRNGTPDPNGNYEKVTLQHGGFIVDGSKLNAKLNRATPQINSSTCSLDFTGSGPTTVGSGTGAYAGISGAVTITVTFAGIAPRKGSSCNIKAEPSGQFNSITGTGHVSFS